MLLTEQARHGLSAAAGKQRQVLCRDATLASSRSRVVCQLSSSKPVPALHGGRLAPVRKARCVAPTGCRKSRCIVAEATQASPAVTEEPRGPQWNVHKFGGTCMASADRIDGVMKLVMNDTASPKRLVVVSAMGSNAASPIKVTDLILNMIQKAAKQDQGFLVDLAALQEKHIAAARQLLGDSQELIKFVGALLDDIANLKAMLQAISIAGMVADAFSDFVVGHGELWSARLLAGACRLNGADVKFMDTRDVLVVTPTQDGTSVDLNVKVSQEKMDAWFKKNGAPELIIATGFIARNPQGQATTLRRNGSDFSATILGSLLRSSFITIWTDVDGVYSADPRKVPEAVCLPSLTYHEAWELSYFGANVLHPRATLPAMKDGIPVAIRNFFNQAAPGTIITDAAVDCGDMPTVKGFATIDRVSIINVTGTGMVGVPGIASAIFSTVRDAGVNVVVISQASSEHSICFAVLTSEADLAVQVLNHRFRDAIEAGRVESVTKEDNCSVLAAVGCGMVDTKGVCATMFSALAAANVNIKVVAQGSSEYNITVVIDAVNSVKALRAVHARFYLSDVPIGIGLVGPGLIGSTFLEQLHEQAEALRKQFKIDLRVLGITGSKKMLLSNAPLDLASWKEDLASKGEPADLEKFGQHLASSYVPNTVIVDCTASDAPPSSYLSWMKKGIHVITPNKKLGSGPLDRYTAIRKYGRSSFLHFFYEGTVGAGLPIMGTLKHLLETGDRIIAIEGVFSGTLSYIFNSFTPGSSFSAIVAEAKAKGYTEPDPRDDLNGTDVARKVTILARECGLHLELEHVPVQSLVPEPLRACSTAEEYMSRLPEFDHEMETKLKAAEAAGKCLRYVGVVDAQNGTGSVELREYPVNHAFAQLSGSDNIISFTTARYFKQPLIVRGPGAGADVTAAGVFSDLLRLAAYLGAPS